MSDLTEKLRAAGIPSVDAMHEEARGFDEGMVAQQNGVEWAAFAGVRAAIAADAPAILRVLLEARLGEMGAVQVLKLATIAGALADDLEHDDDTAAKEDTAALLSLLAPEADNRKAENE